MEISGRFYEVKYDFVKLSQTCGADDRISASCENASSAKLALIYHQTQNLLFYV